jgi:hypothetical protein
MMPNVETIERGPVVSESMVEIPDDFCPENRTEKQASRDEKSKHIRERNEDSPREIGTTLVRIKQ